MRKIQYIILLLGIAVLQGCKSYTSNIILRAEEGDINWKATYTKAMVEYPIKPGDKIQFTVYTNQGEAIIDPSGNLVNAAPSDGEQAGGGKPVFDVLESGACHFPLIGKISVSGLRTSQLDSLLSVKYEAYYNGVYIISKIVNKKIIVLGGKGGQILPYTTNMNLLEALALYGGLDEKSKGYNIRVIRGDLKNPELTVVNLRTVQDMRKTVVNLLPDDIVYIEPIRRQGTEAIRDNMYVFSILQMIITMTLVINSLAR